MTTSGLGGHGPASQKRALENAKRVEKRVMARFFIFLCVDLLKDLFDLSDLE